MKAFLKGTAIVIGLMFLAGLALAISPQVGIAFAATLLVVPFIALFKPLPKFGLGHRGFSIAVMLLVGLPALLAATANDQEAGKLASLKKTDPAAYLAELKATDQTKYLAELAKIDPARHKAELARIAQDEAARTAALKAKQEAQKAAADAKVAKAAKAKVDQYVEQLDRELTSLPSVRASNYTSSIDKINEALILIGAWNLLYENGADLDLGPDGQQKRERFKALLIRKQAEMFPALRDAYGPIMRKKLWIADGSARTIGAGYRTVEFVSGTFALHANIQKIEEQMYDQLMMLRFTRSQYKWFDQASEYSYYDLKPPKDTDLVSWQSNGNFRLLD
ncbi:hypothetical protein [Acidimangrovimonas sediminis]|uniref:hypothetical protein n=1 Tax=Acidimangrovimonas sediminis TaxID=2056283 RepID=UPI000C803DA7|nr:hypothetical protein [Acidimangrovimonas sediminis]